MPGYLRSSCCLANGTLTVWWFSGDPTFRGFVCLRPDQFGDPTFRGFVCLRPDQNDRINLDAYAYFISLLHIVFVQVSMFPWCFSTDKSLFTCAVW